MFIVSTDKYNYMGLPEGTEIKSDVGYDVGQERIYFTHLGKQWTLVQNEFRRVDDSPSAGPIKSDGGSSSYYDLSFPEWLLYTLNERHKEGKCYIKTEELIRALFKNDFSFGTLFKSLVRAFQITQGSGKAGNDMNYECGKIHYYADKIKEQQEKK